MERFGPVRQVRGDLDAIERRGISAALHAPVIAQPEQPAAPGRIFDLQLAPHQRVALRKRDRTAGRCDRSGNYTRSGASAGRNRRVIDAFDADREILALAACAQAGNGPKSAAQRQFDLPEHGAGAGFQRILRIVAKAEAVEHAGAGSAGDARKLEGRRIVALVDHAIGASGPGAAADRSRCTRLGGLVSAALGGSEQADCEGSAVIIFKVGLVERAQAAEQVDAPGAEVDCSAQHMLVRVLVDIADKIGIFVQRPRIEGRSEKIPGRRVDRSGRRGQRVVAVARPVDPTHGEGVADRDLRHGIGLDAQPQVAVCAIAQTARRLRTGQRGGQRGGQRRKAAEQLRRRSGPTCRTGLEITVGPVTHHRQPGPHVLHDRSGDRAFEANPAKRFETGRGKAFEAGRRFAGDDVD